MSPAVRRRVKWARNKAAYRRFFPAGEQLERRDLLATVFGNLPGAVIPQVSCDCECTCSRKVGSVDPNTGGLRLSPRETPLTEARAFFPTYSSDILRNATVTADIQGPSSSPPDVTAVETTFNASTGAPIFFDTSGLTPYQEFRISDVVDVSSLGPGRYPYTMDFTEYNSGTPGTTYNKNGYVFVAAPNALLSPGWYLPGIDRLTVDSGNGALWQTGEGEMYWFTESVGTYSRPAGDLQYSALVDNLDGTFTLSNRFGDTIEFNSLGYVTEKRDRNDNWIAFGYADEDGDSDVDDISEIELADGRIMEFDYTTVGPLTTLTLITDFDGREVQLAYDGDDQLESLTYPDPGAGGDALEVTYAYIYGTSFLATIDEGGNTTNIGYGFANDVIARTNQDGQIDEYKAVLPRGLADTGSGEGDYGTPASVRLLADMKGTKEDPDGGITTFVLGAFGYTEKIIDALGFETVFVLNGDGRVTSRTDPDPDGSGGTDYLTSAVTTFYYSGAGNLQSMYLPYTGSRAWVYDSTWNVPEQYTDELGLVTKYQIDPANGNVEIMREVVGNVDDIYNLETDDLVTEYLYTDPPSSTSDPPGGLVRSILDPLGRTTLITYNPRGNPLTITYADGTADEGTITFHYGALGLIDYQLDELGRRTDFEHDDLGRLTKMLLPDPDGSKNPLPRPEFEWQFDDLSRVIKEIDALDRETVTTYDARDRVESVKLPDHDADKSLTTFLSDYYNNGTLKTTTDPLGRVTTYTHDATQRLTKITLPAVLDPLTAASEVQIVDFDGATAGTFKLNGNAKSGTIDLTNLSKLQSVLDGLWGSGKTLVTYDSAAATVTFMGSLAETNVAQMTTSDFSGLGGAAPFVATDTAGKAASSVNPVLETKYYNDGTLKQSIDALGNATLFYPNYNGHELTITLADPDAGAGLKAPVIVRKFDAAFNLTEEKDARGHYTYLDYDIFGRLETVTAPDPDQYGDLVAAVTTNVYDKGHRLIQTTDSVGNVYGYLYDNRDRLTKITAPDPDGASGPLSAPVTEYKYNLAGELTHVADPMLRMTEYVRDDLGRVDKVILPDPDGKGGVDPPEVKYTYDEMNNTLTVTDAMLSVTKYKYDALNNMIERTDPDPDGKSGLVSAVTAYVFDAARQLLSETQVLDFLPDRTRKWAYDDLGRVTSQFGFDPDATGPSSSPETKTRYDLAGNVFSITDPLLHTTNYAYDHLNRHTKTEQSDPDGYGAVGRPTTLFGYDENSNMTSLIDPVGNETKWAFDGLNRVIQEENQLTDKRAYIYNQAGDMVRKTDRRDRVTLYGYDQLHRLTTEEWWVNDAFPTMGLETMANGSVTDELQVVGFYDATNFISGTFTLTFDGQTTSAIPWDADEATLDAALEALSNIGAGDIEVYKLINFSNQQVWWVTFTNDLGGTDLAQMSIDATSVYNSVGAPTETEFEYNPGVTIGEQQVVTLYDTTGGTFTLSFGGQTTTALEWDATNSDVDTALEALSTIGTVTVSGSAGGPYTVTFTGAQAGLDLAAIKFDDTGLTNASYLQTISTQYNANGELESASDPVADYSYTRDGLGRVTQEVLALTGYGSTITLDQTFNANSLRTQSEFAFGTTGVVTQDFAYDDASRLKETAQYDGASSGLMIWKRAQFTYSQNHLLEDIYRAQGSSGSPTTMFTTNYDRDPADRVNSIMHFSGSWTIDLYDEYTFDAADRITSMMSAVDGFTTYTYDTTNQLIGANWATQADETYTYDENGNRTMAGYDTDPNNRLMSDGNYNYTYDLEGNRLTKTDVITGYVEENVWDHRNRLEAVIYKDDLDNVLAVVDMRYDYQNRLVRRTHDDDGPGANDPVDRLFVYDAYQIVLQFDNANMASDAGPGNLSHLYFWSTTTDFLLADETIDASPTSTDLLWAAPDHLGTVRDWVAYNSGTSTQFVANHRDYDSYGNMLSQTNVAYASSIGFTGRYFETITGYQFNLHRWYDPKVGEWFGEDPLGFQAGDTNLGRYVNNEPVRFVDPLGLERPGNETGWDHAINAMGGFSDVATLGIAPLIRWGLGAEPAIDRSSGYYWGGAAAPVVIASAGALALPSGIGAGTTTIVAGGTTAGVTGSTGTIIVGGSTAGGGAAAGTGSIIVSGSTVSGGAAAGTGSIIVGASAPATAGTLAATGTLTVTAPAIGASGTAAIVTGAGVAGSGIIITGAGIAASASFDTGIIGGVAYTSPYWGAVGWSALNVIPVSNWSWAVNTMWLYRMSYLATPVLCRPGGPVTAREIVWLNDHGYVMFGDLLVKLVGR